MLSRTRKGFTLLELIVVIVILGILAAIAIPTFKAVIDKSKFASLKESAQAVGNNMSALAAFDRVPVQMFNPGVNGSAVDKAGYAAWDTATTTEIPSGMRAVKVGWSFGTSANSGARFLVTRDAAAVGAVYACVIVPNTSTGAKVYKDAIIGTATESDATAACNNVTF